MVVIYTGVMYALDNQERGTAQEGGKKEPG